MERIRFQSSSNTIGMCYCALTKKFWTIVYRLCKGVGLKFFSGEKNWGQVINNKYLMKKYSAIITVYFQRSFNQGKLKVV